MSTDRHGRARRVDSDPRRRPSDGYRVRGSDRFRRVVGEAVAALPERFTQALRDARLRVEEVPGEPMSEPSGEVRLATFDAHTLTVYRRPIEIRAEDRGALEETIMIAVGQAVARHLGWDDDIEELFGD